MPQPLWFYRTSTTDAAVAAHTRDLIRECREVLRMPVPDTFLGRRTHEPFPELEEITLAPELPAPITRP